MLGEDRKEVWGRPVGIAVGADGSLLVVDDAHQRIYRISHK
jgi:glucose/arabinose dehydrogenase